MLGVEQNLNPGLLRKEVVIADSALGLNTDGLIDIFILDGFVNFEGVASRMIFPFFPSDLNAAGQIDVDVYPMDVDFKLIVKTFLHWSFKK